MKQNLTNEMPPKWVFMLIAVGIVLAAMTAGLLVAYVCDILYLIRLK